VQTVLKITNLSKHYGRIIAVDKLSFEVEKGSVFGILGPNGSGKTTTLGILLDVVQPKEGTYKWFGQPSSSETRKRLGAILETPNFYPYLSAERNLKLVANIKEKGHGQIDDVLKQVRLHSRRKSPFKTFSLGMKQRLALAAAMLGEPEVLILDEPTNGLDPQGIADVRELILKISKQGVTIILASHLLDEVEKVCTHVCVLKQGSSVYNGKVADMVGGSNIAELKTTDLNRLSEVLRTWPTFESAKQEGDKIIATFTEEVDGARLSEFLMQNEIALSHLAIRKTSLEQQFLELLKS